MGNLVYHFESVIEVLKHIFWDALMSYPILLYLCPDLQVEMLHEFLLHCLMWDCSWHHRHKPKSGSFSEFLGFPKYCSTLDDPKHHCVFRIYNVAPKFGGRFSLSIYSLCSILTIFYNECGIIGMFFVTAQDN